MPSNWSDVEKTTAGGLPTMPTQAIIIGTVLGIGAISCSGFYLSMMGGNVALVPWMCVMLAVAVIFTYVVGFALLWCAESFTLRMRAKFAITLNYAVFGFLAFMLGQAFAPKLCTRKPLALALLAVQVVLAVFGVVAMVMMFSALYR